MPREINWEAVARANTHRLQLAILEHLVQVGEDSPNRMRQQFGDPLGNVSYHVRALKEAGLLRLTRTEPRRGSVEHYYQLTDKAMTGGAR